MKKFAFSSFLALITVSSLLAKESSSSSDSGRPRVSSPQIRVRAATSENWCGYVASASPANNTVTSVSGNWTVPSVGSTPMDTYSVIWVGIDGATNKTTEQIGTGQDFSPLTGATYFAWYEMYPKNSVQIPSVTIHPGDSISASVTTSGNGNFVLTISNNSTGQNFTTTQKNNSAKRASAEWIVEAPTSKNKVLPLANFGTVTFTGCDATINGITGPINDPAWSNEPLIMVNSTTGQVKAQPSPLSPDGTSFSVNWLHS